ncbi:MAG: methyltransferase [Planctomycetaceae bacterium]|nr:methyltransferase [Planctomycetaceae bacterium]
MAPASSTHSDDGKLLNATSAAEVIEGTDALPTLTTHEMKQLVNNFNRMVMILQTLNRQLGSQQHLIAQLRENFEFRNADLAALLMAVNSHAAQPPVTLNTQYPVAADSVDHTDPRGTKDDNTRWPRFVAACERHFGRKLKYIDMGCAGGGLVFDFLVRGHLAIGLEGSDYSRRNLRAEWRTIPNNLYTCDISRPFTLTDSASQKPFQADVISMWEVLEHISAERLPTLIATIREHLTDDGIFVGSVATYDDEVNGVHYHVTIEPREWWEELFRENGLAMIDEPIFDKWDYCRGIGRDAADSSYYADTYDTSGVAQFRPGFHVVARRSPLGPKAGQAPPTMQKVETTSSAQMDSKGESTSGLNEVADFRQDR